jgi:hypothetical protein
VSNSRSAPAWLVSAAAWLTPRRIRAHAILLAVCLWGVCAFDFIYPGPFDRAANIKFQDFLSFYISGNLIAEGRASELYNEPLRQAELLSIVRPVDITHETIFPPTAQTPGNLRLPNLYGPQVALVSNVRLPNLYGPQVALFFVPLARFSFLTAALIWVALSLLIYFLCIYSIWKCCPHLRPNARLVAIAALAYPPLFHFFVRGQLSALVLACFTLAFLALHREWAWLAGVALGVLIFKPQFLVAIPLILLLAHAWKMLSGLILSSSLQLALTRIHFGPSLMHAYVDTLHHPSRWIATAELSLAPIQMHSLRSFWMLLIPSSGIALTLYLVSSLSVVWVAAAIWKSKSPLALRFSALTLAVVLVNPHLFVYDLLVLAPALLLVTDWTLGNEPHPSTPGFRVLVYLVFALTLLGPLSRWTHLQLSVIAFVALLWMVYRSVAANPKLAGTESIIV